MDGYEYVTKKPNLIRSNPFCFKLINGVHPLRQNTSNSGTKKSNWPLFLVNIFYFRYAYNQSIVKFLTVPFHDANLIITKK